MLNKLAMPIKHKFLYWRNMDVAILISSKKVRAEELS